MSNANVAKPIFIVGAPRSGTTLLRSILDAHPNICCPTWETGLFDRLAGFIGGDFNKRGSEPNFCSLPRSELVAWMRRCCDDLMATLLGNVGKPRWGEKTPAHVFHIDLIHEVYPEGQFVHIIRNGYEVVRSLQNVEWSPRNIRWSVQRWQESVRAGREAAARLPAGAYTEVRYEELVAQPEATIRSLCQFLGEEFSSDLLDFNKADKNSWGLQQQPIQKKPVHQYRPLSMFERTVFSMSAKPLMRELGYS